MKSVKQVREEEQRRVKEAEARAWARIHGELADLLSEIKYLKSNKQYVKLTYGRSMEVLKKRCMKIMNLIDSKRESRWD